MSDFCRGKEHRGGIGTRGDACATPDAGGCVKRGFRRILGNKNRIRVRSAPGGRSNEASGLNDAIKRRTVNSQIAQDRKCARAPGFEGYRITVLKKAHGKLANSCAAPATVRYSVDQETASTANSFAAIMFEGNGRFASVLEIFVEQI